MPRRGRRGSGSPQARRAARKAVEELGPKRHAAASEGLKLARLPEPGSPCHECLLKGNCDAAKVDVYDVVKGAFDPIPLIRDTVGKVRICLDYAANRYYIFEPLYALTRIPGIVSQSRAQQPPKEIDLRACINYAKRALLLYSEAGPGFAGEEDVNEYYESVRESIEDVLAALAGIRGNVCSMLRGYKDVIRYYVLRDIVGLDVLEPVITDSEHVEDVVVPQPRVPIKVSGKFYNPITGSDTYLANVEFDTYELNTLIERIVSSEGRSISLFWPLESIMIKRGHRVTVSYGNEATYHGPALVVRMFSEPWNITRQFLYRGLQPVFASILGPLIAEKKSVLIVGVMGSGKTSLLNSLASFIPKDKTIVTIEDTPEIMLPHTFWIRHITRPSVGLEQRGEIDMFTLVKHALRESADYIVIGEVRGEEGRIWAQAISTGHGGLTTFHADSPSTAVARLTSHPINVEPALLEALYNIAMIQRRGRHRYLSQLHSVVVSRDVVRTRSIARLVNERVTVPGGSADVNAAKVEITLPDKGLVIGETSVIANTNNEIIIFKKFSSNGDVQLYSSKYTPADTSEQIVTESRAVFQGIGKSLSSLMVHCGGDEACRSSFRGLGSIYDISGIDGVLKFSKSVALIYEWLEMLYLVTRLADAIDKSSGMHGVGCRKVLEKGIDYLSGTVIVWALLDSTVNKDAARKLNELIMSMASVLVSTAIGRTSFSECRSLLEAQLHGSGPLQALKAMYSSFINEI